MAKKPSAANARREIARVFGEPVVLETCAAVRDPRRLLEQGLVTMVRISNHEDPAFAMQAGKWLVEYATRVLEREPQPKGNPKNERVEIIAELRGLYQKALSPNPLVVPEGATIDMTSES